MKARGLTVLVLMLIVVLPAGATIPEQRAGPPRAQADSSSGLSRTQTDEPPAPADLAQAREPVQSAPLMFIENVGQFDDRARFQVRGGHGTLWLAEDAIWITWLEPQPAQNHEQGMWPMEESPSSLVIGSSPTQGVNLKLSFVGANPHPSLEPFNRQETSVNYFLGNDPARWHTNVPVWGGVRYKDIYPGTDLIIGYESRFEATDAIDPSNVRLRVEGADALTLVGNHLRLSTATGEFFLLPLAVARDTLDGPPAVAPEVNSVEILEKGPATFEVSVPFAPPPFVASSSPHPSLSQSPRDSPEDLLFSTFLGGSDVENPYAIAVDEGGSIYVSGQTMSVDFPTAPGAFDAFHNGNWDAFVVKVSASGAELIYATYLGGGEKDFGHAIAIDGSGSAFVTGNTNSFDFPTTPHAFDTVRNGTDAFVAKLCADGADLVYATFLGGAQYDHGEAIAVDNDGHAFVVGDTRSSDFPTTPDAFDTSHNGGFGFDAYITKVNVDGSELVYSSFLGGSDNDYGTAVAVADLGSAFVAGNTYSGDFPITPGSFDTSPNGGGDAFVVQMNADGAGLVYGTFLGGSDRECDIGVVGTTRGHCTVALDEAGQAYVAGSTASSDFPITPGAFDTTYNGNYDAFVVKLSAEATGLTYATFVGGNDMDLGRALSVDGTGRASLTGLTTSSDFPITPGTFDTSYNEYGDSFVARLNVNGTELAYATFLGGSSTESSWAIASDSAGNVYVTGHTFSSDFPVTPGAFDISHNANTDAFLAKLAAESGSGNTLSISGRVTDADGDALSGVTVSAGAGVNATTNTNGDYAITDLITGTYTLTPSKSGYSFSPLTRTVGVPPTATGQDFAGTPGASPGFLPNPNGYQFRNKKGQASWDIFRDTYGAANVEFTLLGKTRPYPLAYAYYRLRYVRVVEGGSCSGMSTSSGLIFDGRVSPSDFLSQQGVAQTWNLPEPTATNDIWDSTPVSDLIVRYQGYADGKNIRNARNTAIGRTLTETLEAITAAIDLGQLHEISIWGTYMGKCAGHALLPYRYELAAASTKVYVYDPNHHGEPGQFLTISPSRSTWTYASDLLGVWGSYDSCAVIGAIPLTYWYDRPTPPWQLQLGNRSATIGPYDLSIGDTASLLIHDAQGRELGFRDGELVSEIPGGFLDIPAAIIPGITPSYPERYYINSDLPITFTIQYSDTSQAPLVAFVPGGLVQAVGVAPTAGVTDSVRIAPDASQVTITGQGLGDGRSLSILQEENGLGQQYTISNLSLDSSSRAATLATGATTNFWVDPMGEVITFTTSADLVSYTVQLSQLGITTTEILVSAPPMAADDTQIVSVDWTNTTTVTVEIDHGSDGTVDETVVLENEYVPYAVYLPVVLR